MAITCSTVASKGVGDGARARPAGRDAAGPAGRRAGRSHPRRSSGAGRADAPEGQPGARAAPRRRRGRRRDRRRHQRPALGEPRSDDRGHRRPRFGRSITHRRCPARRLDWLGGTAARSDDAGQAGSTIGAGRRAATPIDAARRRDTTVSGETPTIPPVPFAAGDAWGQLLEWLQSIIIPDWNGLIGLLPILAHPGPDRPDPDASSPCTGCITPSPTAAARVASTSSSPHRPSCAPTARPSSRPTRPTASSTS